MMMMMIIGEKKYQKAPWGVQRFPSSLRKARRWNLCPLLLILTHLMMMMMIIFFFFLGGPVEAWAITTTTRTRTTTTTVGSTYYDYSRAARRLDPSRRSGVVPPSSSPTGPSFPLSNHPPAGAHSRRTMTTRSSSSSDDHDDHQDPPFHQPTTTTTPSSSSSSSSSSLSSSDVLWTEPTTDSRPGNPFISSSTTTTTTFSWTTVGQQKFHIFRQLALPYYQESPTGRWLLATLLGLTLLNSGVSVAFSYLGKDFWNALSAQQAEEFTTVLQKYLVALVIGAPIVTLYRYQREQLAVHWREWMTARTMALYTQNRVYYSLERQPQLIMEKKKEESFSSSSSAAENFPTGPTVQVAAVVVVVDNPDQRIAEDVRAFTAYSLQFLITIITSLIDLVSFSFILWSIYPQLFVAIILYAAVGTGLTLWLGRSLIPLNFMRLQKEADLRYALVRFRDNAESIAFYAGEDLEGQGLEKRLEQVMNNRRALNTAERNLEWLTTSYRYLVQILPVAVIAPRYFAGEIALGVISQSVGAFNHILSDLSLLINQFESLSAFSAGMDRLGTFYTAMRQLDPQRSPQDPLLSVVSATVTTTTTTTTTTTPLVKVNTTRLPDETAAQAASSAHLALTDGLKKHVGPYGTISLEFLSPLADGGATHREDPSTILSIRHLDLCTPDQERLLIRDLSVQLNQGEHLLIVGSSGTGKSSLLRGIAGLWTKGNGSIVRPPDEQVYFLPQRPYCTLGSLKDQLLYPLVETLALSNHSGTAESTFDSHKTGTAVNGNRLVPRSHLLKQSLSDTELLEILVQVDLIDVARRAGGGDAARGLYCNLDWSSRLSLGEQQRLAFGRLLVNRPRLVILDEATSALDIEAERRMYNLLQHLSKNWQDHLADQQEASSGLTYISVGHRPSLLAFHNKKLRLDGEGRHELTDIEATTAIVESSNLT